MYSKMYFVFSRNIQFDIFIVSNIRILFTDVWPEIRSKKPSGLPTRHWPQTQSRESSGSRSNRINAGSFPLLPESSKTSEIPTLPLPLSSGSRSNRIDAGPFPLLPEPSKTSEIPTLPLPGRSNPDNSFGLYDFYPYNKTFLKRICLF